MVVINWLKDNDTVDRGEYKPGSEVEIRSVFHTDDVDAYQVYERPPKMLKLFAREDRWATALPAKPLAPVQGRFHTANMWKLPAPKDKKDGRLTFVAKVGDASSGTISSASMLITSEVHKSKAENRGKLSGKTKPLPGTEAAFEVEHKSSDESTIDITVAPTLDPEVEIKLLQGDDVRAHVAGLVAEWFEEGSAERSSATDAIDNALTEYVEDAWSIEFPTQHLHLSPPDAVTFPLRIPPSDGLRAVICLQVDDLDHKTTTISEPRFITVVDGQIVMSDLVPSLFDDQTRALAKEFSGHLQGDGEKLSTKAADLGAQLVDVLGTSDIDDVVALLSLQYGETA